MSIPLLIWALFWNAILLAKAVFWSVPLFVAQGIWGRSFPMPGSGQKQPPYAMMLSFIEWDGAWQRPQHLACGLQEKGMDAVYCAPVRIHNLPLAAPALLFNPRSTEKEGVIVLRPLVLPREDKFPMLRALNTLLLYRCLRKEILRRQKRPDLFYCNTPFHGLTASWIPADLRLYDVMDELVRFPPAPQEAQGLERLTVAQADLVTTGTLSLSHLKARQYEDLGAAPRYIPCGADSGRFANPGPEPADIAKIAGPILGFFGAVNERLDAALLAELARTMTKTSIVVIGPVYQGWKNQLDKVGVSFDSLKNVHFLGPRPYEKLPDYLACFDVALVPYRLTDGVEFVQPVKILEYLAGGKPVVSTAIPDVMELFSDVVRIGRDAGDFIEKIKEALREEDRSEVYRTKASGRSWTSMVDQFYQTFLDKRAEKEKEPVRVMHLLHGIHYGGAEEVVVNLCAAHDRQKVRPAICLLGRGATMEKRMVEKNVLRCHVPMKGRLDLGIVFPLAGVMRSNKIDLINTHTGRTNLLGRLVWKLAGIPVVTTVQSAVARDINDFRQSTRLNSWIEKRTLKWSACFLPVSRHNGEELKKLGVAPEKIVHIPNGVPSVFPIPTAEELVEACREVFPSAIQAPVIGMLASMRPRKGPESLLRAMPIILKEMPETRLLMVGSGEFVESVDYLETLKALARELGIAQSVIFTGHRDDPRRMMCLMDVVILPSLFGEGLPLTILEAMALGKPVVSTCTEGNEEAVVDGETGYLVPPGDSEKLADAVLKLLGDPDARKGMGWAGRKRLEQEYSIETMAQRYTRVYKDVLGR